MICNSFKIASVFFDIFSPCELHLEPCLHPFLTEERENVRYRYRYEIGAAQGDELENAEKVSGRNYYKVYRKQEEYLRVTDTRMKGREVKVILKPGIEKGQREILLPACCLEGEGRLFDGRNLMNYLGLEEILLARDAIILHASFVRYRGVGILFSAPSGTGKSTQAELWERYRGAEILNGDRTVIRREKKGYRAYGSPYAGSSGIYKNESAPLKCIVLLSQGTENRIERSGKKESFIRLFRETLVNSWNTDFMEKAMELMRQIVEEVPCYAFVCRKNEDAVRVVEQNVFEKEIEI